MKALVVIDSIELSRKYQRQDGTMQNIHRVVMHTESDQFAAETFQTKESMEKRGIVPGAVGSIELEFKVSRGTSKSGEPYCVQNIRLSRFELANRNINVQAAAPADAAVEEAPVAEPAAEEAQINPETGLPF